MDDEDRPTHSFQAGFPWTFQSTGFDILLAEATRERLCLISALPKIDRAANKALSVITPVLGIGSIETPAGLAEALGAPTAR